PKGSALPRAKYGQIARPLIALAWRRFFQFGVNLRGAKMPAAYGAFLRAVQSKTALTAQCQNALQGILPSGRYRGPLSSNSLRLCAVPVYSQGYRGAKFPRPSSS